VTLALIVNPSAGGGRAGRALPGVVQKLLDLGLEHRVLPTRSLEHARELATEAIAAGEIALAMGGDGLIAAVASAVAHTPGTLGVLPGGRGNDFARALGIPLEPRAACSVLASGAVRVLDLGRAADATFIGIASCGFDSEANRIANETRLIRGKLVYAYGALRALAGYSPATFTVTLDERPPHTFTGFTVAAANSSAYGGGMHLAPDASMDDGLLDVVMIAEMPKRHFLRLLPTVFSGTHVRQPEVKVARARKLHVTADRPIVMFADGDPIGELPVTVEAQPSAVRVLVPSS
jgi:YegS/Rv2252/BmrU family lipid kinase